MHINYKQKYQWNWIYYTVPISAVFISTLVTIATGCNHLPYTMNSTVFIQRTMAYTNSMSLIIFLHCIYERFSLVNYYLRYNWTFRLNSNIQGFVWKRYFSSAFAGNRNQFLETNILANRNGRKDLIEITKFIGRQHSYLIDVLDRINFCYTFQVNFHIWLYLTWQEKKFI